MTEISAAPKYHREQWVRDRLAEQPTQTNGHELSALFAKWAENEGILARITEEQCADLAKAFMAGYAHGLKGNAERS